MLGQNVSWSDLTITGAFLLGLLVGIVIVLRVARVGAHLVDRYIDHRFNTAERQPSDSAGSSSCPGAGSSSGAGSRGSTRLGSGRSGETSNGSAVSGSSDSGRGSAAGVSDIGGPYPPDEPRNRESPAP